jgi:hypothetical protein
MMPGVHHRDALGHLGHDAEIMGDEKQAELQFAPEAIQQIQDLLLHSDVEGRCGLVGDQQPRPGGQRHGNHRGLTQAAGKLVRKLCRAGLRFGDRRPSQRIDPDSPTKPSDSPASMRSDTSLTGRTQPTGVGNSTVSPRTSSNPLMRPS